MNFDDQIEIRGIDILGETDWFWVKSDDGRFSDARDGSIRSAFIAS